MQRGVKDKNVLEKFVLDFCKIVEAHNAYIVVSGFVVIACGRTRATEDIDMILPKMSKSAFITLHQALIKGGFEAIQGSSGADLYDDYLEENSSVRYVRVGSPLPEMEVKLAKDPLDDYQLQTRTKIQLTGLDIWFSSVEMNIAFKEELLKGQKDIEDATHLRAVFEGEINEKEIAKIKTMLKRYR